MKQLTGKSGTLKRAYLQDTWYSNDIFNTGCKVNIIKDVFQRPSGLHCIVIENPNCPGVTIKLEVTDLKSKIELTPSGI